MKRPRILYPIFLAACLWTQMATPGFAAQDPSDIFVQALLASQSGEKLAADGKPQEALAKFRFAAGLLDQIKADSPKWQPLVREYRSKKTAEFISKLESTTTRDPSLLPAKPGDDESLIPGATPSRQPTPPPVPDEPLPEISGPAGSAEAAELRRQVTEARLEIKRLRAQNNDLTQKYEFASANLREALKKVDQSRVAVAELRSQVAQTEDRLRTASSAQKKDAAAIETLKKSVASLKQKLSERAADANLVEDEANELSKTVAQANERAAKATQDRDAAVQERDAAVKEKAEAVQARDTALADLEKATQDKAAADQAIAANATLTAKLDAAERQVADLSERPAPADVEALKTQIADIQKQLSAAKDQTQVDATNIEELKAQLETSNKELEEARKKGASEEETLQLKSENDLLRGIVIRTIKDQVKRNQAREIVAEELARIEGKSQALLDQVDVLGAATLQLSDEERKLFKEPELAVLDASGPGLSVEMTQTDPDNVRPILPGTAPSTTAGATPAPSPAAEANPTPTLTVPDKYASLVTRAKKLFDQGKLPDAERAYNEILADDPNNLYALSNLGVVNYKMGKLVPSEKALTKAAAIAPKDFFVNCTLGIVYYRQGKFEKAIESLTHAITIDPTSATAHNYLGIAASQKGWFEAAVKELEKATTLNPQYPDAWFNLAVVYATSEPPQLDKARECYEKAVALGAEPDPALEKLFK
ncbi:MAG TPA: tetratricopeptide repeat protein [Chthoniobacterales bacterium]|jgi:Flp pilus assembly protein TadD